MNYKGSSQTSEQEPLDSRFMHFNKVPYSGAENSYEEAEESSPSGYEAALAFASCDEQNETPIDSIQNTDRAEM